MSKFPALSGSVIINVLKKSGFVVKRQKGSHVFLSHLDGRATVVPIHSGETIGPGLFAKILRDTELTRADFVKPVKK
jgi:predicted RNA binding protein YcfA (HicA-like mRNA interferase family)